MQAGAMQRGVSRTYLPSSVFPQRSRFILITPRATTKRRYDTAVAPDSPIPAVEASVVAQIKLYAKVFWQKGVLHGSIGGDPIWKDIPMERVPSSPGKWLRCTIPVPNMKAASDTKPLLEFVLNNGQNQWDKPAAGGNYIITAAGDYAIQGGTLSTVQGKAVMVVSDLDGTMVGDDAATSAFKAWWEDKAIPRGGVLVYNTGRSLEAFYQLLKEKSHCLAVPDALISAVGTKIYTYTGTQWREDTQWGAQLDKGWRLEVAREACYQALAKVGKERMHFRPADEQNKHKVTCGVAVAVLDQVLSSIEVALVEGGVKANIITSGHGEWRFLDLVPLSGGKLQALEYIREQYGFPVQSTVACGDSGNDILMLQGENPAVIVGNAQSDLVKWADARVALENPGSGPEGKQRLFRAGKHEALGILEALDHWGFK